MASRGRGKPSMSNAGGSDGDDELATSFSQFARAVEQQQDAATTLDEVVRAAISLIPGCDEASISVILGRHRVTSEAASGDLPRAVDAIQELLGEGPCLQAAYTGETVRVSDMSSETRWPRFTGAALEAGAAGMMCFQLYVTKDNLGALNLFSRTPGTFDDESEHVDQKIATGQLIGQAQGILMDRHKLKADDAFALLVRVSQQRNVKLRDVAEGLVRSGQLDEPRGSQPS